MWGVYKLQARDGAGDVVEANDRAAVKWFVRWRVNEGLHKRTFDQKGYARTFREGLRKAQLLGWPADDNGWPIDPERAQVARETAPARAQPSFASYCDGTWWPIMSPTFTGKNLQGHRKNMRTAKELIVYRPGDPRIGQQPGAVADGSILLGDLVADDLRRALTTRRTMNSRTSATNTRRIETAIAARATDIQVAAQTASAATIRAFYITLSMIVKAAMRSGHTVGDPLDGLTKLAPASRGARLSSRLVPSVEEVFDLADAIGELGRMVDGRFTGDRYRSLVLVAGTMGPRPGELVAHRPEWFNFGAPTTVEFRASESLLYDVETGQRGVPTNPLKHRLEGEARVVPALDAVADVLREHLERGYPGHDRTWTSPTGRGRLSWGNLRDGYWRPACEEVFAGTAKTELARMSPKMLRKAAITFWHDSGISPFLAAEWAGHSAEVAQRFYTGRSAASYASEVDRMSAHLPARGPARQAD